MNDIQLRSRISATDPMHDGVSTNSINSASAQTLLENIVNIQLDEPEVFDLEAIPPRNSRPPAHTRRWLAPALAIAAVGVVAVGGAAIGGAFDAGGSSDEPTVLALSAGSADAMTMSCLAPDSTVIAQSPVAFRATVDGVDGETITLTVDEWYAGDEVEAVELTAPGGMEALIGGIEFQVGETYLVSAYDGVVSYCGLTGPATPELQSMYDQAFPG